MNNISNAENAASEIIIEYLREHPNEINWRGRVKPDPSKTSGSEIIKQKVIDALRKRIQPSKPTTIPDDIVSEILEIYYGYQKHRLIQIKKEHLDSMAAENIVGALLEKYIYSVGMGFGWVLVPSAIIQKIDFIKKDSNGWLRLQVKNRDNSENSSSAAIREGTSIMKWHRSFSRTGKTNWDKFPDESMSKLLSEKGFREFIESYFINS